MGYRVIHWAIFPPKIEIKKSTSWWMSIQNQIMTVNLIDFICIQLQWTKGNWPTKNRCKEMTFYCGTVSCFLYVLVCFSLWESNEMMDGNNKLQSIFIVFLYSPWTWVMTFKNQDYYCVGVYFCVFVHISK